MMSFYKKSAFVAVLCATQYCSGVFGAVERVHGDAAAAVHTHASGASVLNMHAVVPAKVHGAVHIHAASVGVLDMSDGSRVHAQVHTHASGASVLNVHAAEPRVHA